MSSKVGGYIKPREDISFENEPFLEDDSPNGVILCKIWLENRPKYSLYQGDYRGNNALVEAYKRGNVSVVTYLLENLSADDKKVLNYLMADGNSIFGAILAYPANCGKQRPNVAKIVECTQLLIQAGADVNNKGTELYGRQKNALCLWIDFAEEYDSPAVSDEFGSFEEKIGQYARALIRLFIKAGARYRDTQSFFGPYHKNEWVQEAQTQSKLRNLKGDSCG